MRFKIDEVIMELKAMKDAGTKLRTSTQQRKDDYIRDDEDEYIFQGMGTVVMDGDEIRSQDSFLRTLESNKALAHKWE